jgi:hypothetical protein
MRRIAFLFGLILGSSVSAYVLSSALIYLFTGKLASIRMNEAGQPRLVLIDVDTLYETPSIVPRSTSRLSPTGGWPTGR